LLLVLKRKLSNAITTKNLKIFWHMLNFDLDYMQFIKLGAKQKYWLDFLFTMTKKEIKVRYKRTTLGLTWAILQPLSQMLVMGFIFQFFIPVSVDNYFLFLFAGLLPWNFFVQSLTKSTSAFFYERNLIKKAAFPKESIVLSIILSNLFHFLISLCLLFIVLLINQIFFLHYDVLQLLNSTIRTLWIFPAILLLVLFTSGLSLLTASLNVKFRDINFIVQLCTLLWFYATPIIYSLDLLPESIQSLLYFNPMTLIVSMFHYALIGLPINIPSLIPISLVLTSLTVYLGIHVFLTENSNFDDWV